MSLHEEKQRLLGGNSVEDGGGSLDARDGKELKAPASLQSSVSNPAQWASAEALITASKGGAAQFARSCLDALLRDDVRAYCAALIVKGMRLDSGVRAGLGDAAFVKQILNLLDQSNNATKTEKYELAYLGSSACAYVPGAEGDALAKEWFLRTQADGEASMGRCAVDAVAINLLKRPAVRPLAFSELNGAVIARAAQGLQSSVNSYRGTFILWLVSGSLVSTSPDDPLYASQGQAIQSFRTRNVAVELTRLLDAHCHRSEKVARVALRLMRNILQGDPALCDQALQAGVKNRVAELEYDKWRDAEIYDEIKATLKVLDEQVAKRSNVDSYAIELATSTLRPGLLHTDEFWSENVLDFERNDFSLIKDLVLLLDSRDTQTAVIALQDVTQFIRLHPQGKLVAQRLMLKTKALAMLNHADSQLASCALSCVQRLMLTRAHGDEIAQA